MKLRRQESHIERFAGYFTDGYQHPESIRIFFKVLVAYTLVKTLLIWPVCRSIIPFHALSLPRSVPGKILMGPAYLADGFPDVFFIVSSCFLVVLLIAGSTIVLRVLFFWLTFNLYIVGFPMSDGSDVVLFMLAFWSIPLVRYAKVDSERIQVVRITLFNLALVFCQLQIVFIYAVSGFDKMMSETWRTGEAFAYIEHLEFMYNPALQGFFSSPYWYAVVAWSTILFELLFASLIWNNRMRIPLLLVGTVFHLFIWFALNLPDFSLIMILSYLIFVRDSDYHGIKLWFRPALP